jgi:flavorubredoxin
MSQEMTQRPAEVRTQPMGQTTTSTAPLADAASARPRVIFPDKLFALGGAFHIDGRVSWIPRNATGYQATTCYLLKEGDAYLLVDPGLKYQARTMIRQLEMLVPAREQLSVFLTRSEPDCFGCLEDVFRNYKIQRVITGGGHNPFDGFDDILKTASQLTGRVVPISREGKLAPVDLGPNRHVVVMHAMLRINSTFWLYDTGTRALFVSDSFSHFLGQSYEDALSLEVVGNSDNSTVAAHLFAKFWWLPFADRRNILQALSDMFSKFEITAICPGHGRPIVGTAAVQRACQLMLSTLAREPTGLR